VVVALVGNKVGKRHQLNVLRFLRASDTRRSTQLIVRGVGEIFHWQQSQDAD